MRINAETVDEYLSLLPDDRKAALSHLRQLILSVAPGATESLMYGMPAYDLNGQFCAMASQKGYMSLYILNTPAWQQHRAALSHLDVGKGCIRFKKLSDLPLETIELILRAVAAANRASRNDSC